MGAPFLDGPRLRTEAIKQELRHYFNYLSGMPDEDADGNEILFDEEPPCLHAYNWAERWGFPNPGGWLDQPASYMLDLDAVREAIDEKRAIDKINKKLREAHKEQHG